jgi:hypothetical protein
VEEAPRQRRAKGGDSAETARCALAVLLSPLLGQWRYGEEMNGILWVAPGEVTTQEAARRLFVPWRRKEIAKGCSFGESGIIA